MDEFDFILRLRPEVDDVPEEVVRSSRHLVLASAARRPLGVRSSSSPGFRGSQRRWVMLSPVIAAVVVFIVVLAVVVPPWGRPPAAQALLTAADAAESQPPLTTTTLAGGTPDAPGVRYVRLEAGSLATISIGTDQSYSAFVRTTREQWVASDGSGRVSESLVGVDYPSDADRIGWTRFDGELRLTMNENFGPGGLVYEDYDSLPTDPVALRRALEQVPHGAWPNDVGLLWAAEELLRDGGTPPSLRGALYRVVASIDGIQLLGEVTDRLGRVGTGVALEYTGNGLKWRDVMVFDAQSTALLESETLLLSTTAKYRIDPPITVSWKTYLESGLVNAVP